MATYSFDVEHAKKWGLNEAVFLHNLIHWLRLNKAEQRNVKEGKDGVTRVWSYNTADAILLLYPFWTDNQLRHTIESLEKKGVIVRDKLAKNSFNRTTWFALTDESLLELPEKMPDQQPDEEDDPRFGKFPNSKRGKSQKDGDTAQNDLGNFPNGGGDNPSSLIGSDVQPTTVQPAYIKPTETLNVGEANININKAPGEKAASLSGDTNARDSDDNTFTAVEAVVKHFDDTKSRMRFKQLRMLCRDNNRLGLWTEALRVTENRMKRVEMSKPGAYFCTTLVRLLEDAGITVPAGTKEERAEVSGLIGASLAEVGEENYAAV